MAITKEKLHDYDIKAFSGPIMIANTREEAVKYLRRITENQTVIGFDTETKPKFTKGKKNPVALLQLCNGKEALLIRLNKTGMFPALAEFLSNDNFVKIGIGIRDDIKDLKRLGEYSPQLFLDLNTICEKMGFESIGAVKLSALVLGFKISKRQQTSNWEAQHLSEAQQRYAATDAWICKEIFLRLYENGGFHSFDYRPYFMGE